MVDFLSKQTADGTQENLLDRLENLIYQTSMVANISDETFGNATSGAALAYKLQAMSNLALTFAEAKRRVSKLDIEAFERKAKKYVKDRDFSEQANAEMKLYNLTMKVNRLELLKAEIGLEMIKAHDDINGLTDRVLLERAEEEYRRQAGILGDTVQDIAGKARRIADASFHNATWRDRAWTNHAELKANLDVLLQRGLIRGDNPRQLARSLRKALGVDLNKCERLMTTELARVQIDAAADSFKQNGFERYQYITCGYGDACEDCKALSDKVFKIKDMQAGENAPPMHPWCHCSIAPYEDSEEYEAWLKGMSEGNPNLSAKSVEVDGDFTTSTRLPDDIKQGILSGVQSINDNFGNVIDKISYEPYYKDLGAPFTFIPEERDGMLVTRLNVNMLFNWDESLEDFNKRIYENNYERGVLASKNMDDLLLHEGIHFVTFEDCKTWEDYVLKEARIRALYTPGISKYADRKRDGSESIAETAVRIKNGEVVDIEAKKILLDVVGGLII